MVKRPISADPGRASRSALRNARMIRSVVERTPAAFIADLLVRTTTSWTTSPEQVLARQSKDVRHFLLETSILESLTGPLCDAVTGRDGGKANA